MRPLIVIGLILVVLGTVALAVPSFTYFTTEMRGGLWVLQN